MHSGTGHFATISSWKTIVKETGDIAKRLIQPLPDLSFDLKGLIYADDDEQETADDEIKSPSKKRKKAKSVLSSSSPRPVSTSVTASPTRTNIKENASPSNYATALHSESFLKRVLKPSQVKVLTYAGIQSPDQLMRADKSADSDIVQKLITWRRERGFQDIEIAISVRSIMDWTLTVEKALIELKRSDPNSNDIVFQESDNGHVANNGGDRAQREISTSDPSKQKKKRKSNAPKIFNAEAGEDPIEALTKMTRDFLISEGITSAEQFLSLRTNDLAAKLVAWRAREGLPALKGYGSISIVSGWKGIVRNACEASGLSELLALDNEVRNRKKPNANDSSKGNRSPTSGAAVKSKGKNATKRTTPIVNDMLSNPEKWLVSHPLIMNGLSSRRFTLYSKSDGKFTFFGASIICRLLFSPLIYLMWGFHQLFITRANSLIKFYITALVLCGMSFFTATGAILYGFTLSLRRQKDSETAVSVCLTFAGAQIEIGSKKLESQKEISTPKLPESSAAPEQYQILPEFAGDDSSFVDADHKTFCSLDLTSTTNGMLIDLSRFHLFLSLPNCLDKKAELEDHISRLQGVMERFIFAETQSNTYVPQSTDKKGSGNVFVVHSKESGHRRHILCISDPIEKGQVLKLELDPSAAGASATGAAPSRNEVYEVISSTWTGPMGNFLTFIEEKVLPRILSVMRRAFADSKYAVIGNGHDEDSATGDDGSSITDEDVMKTLVARRRIHFIASIIIHEAYALLGEKWLKTSEHSTL